MGIFFNQRKDTIEWEEYRPDILFYKWNNSEIKKGSRLIIRPGQKAIFYADGKICGIFEKEGSFDINSEIIPLLSSVTGLLEFRKDSGKRAEVYFVNSKELLMKWGTPQRIMIPVPEVPSGVPVGCCGNMVITFRDYLTFIEKVAGFKDIFTLDDVADRIKGELSPILTEAILGHETAVGLNVLIGLQAGNRAIAERIQEEIDKELFKIGLGVTDVDIVSISYPEEIQKMAEKVAAQSFVADTGKYVTLSAADSMQKGGDSSVASLGAQIAVGAQIGRQMENNMSSHQQYQKSSYQQSPYRQPVQSTPPSPSEERFCTKCRKMVSSKYCPDCGTPTV